MLEAQLNKVEEKFDNREHELSTIMFKEKEKLNQMISELVTKTGQLHEMLKSKEKEVKQKNEELKKQKDEFANQMANEIKKIKRNCREEYSDLILNITRQIDEEKKKNDELQDALRNSLVENEKLQKENEATTRMPIEEKEEKTFIEPYSPPPPPRTIVSPPPPPPEVDKDNHTPQKLMLSLGGGGESSQYSVITPVQVRTAAQTMKSKVVDLAKKLAEETCERMVLNQRISRLNMSHSKSIQKYRERLAKIKAENETLRKERIDKSMNHSDISLNDLKDFKEIPGKIEISPPQTINVSNEDETAESIDRSVIYTSKGVVLQKLDLDNSENFHGSNVFCPDNSGMDITGSMGQENMQLLKTEGAVNVSGSLDTSAVGDDESQLPFKSAVTPPLPRPPPPSPSPHHAEEIYASLNTVIGSEDSIHDRENDNGNKTNGKIVETKSHDDVAAEQIEEDVFEVEKNPRLSRGNISKKSPMSKSLVEFEVDWTPKGSPVSSRASSRSNSFSGTLQVETKPDSSLKQTNVDKNFVLQRLEWFKMYKKNKS